MENKTKLEDSKVLIKGLTFKENVPDIRNSKVIDIVKKLRNDNIKVYLDDYNVNNEELKRMYNLNLDKKIPKVNAVVFAVKHKKYYNMTMEDLENLFEKGNENKIIFDFNHIFDKQKLKKRGFKIWNL